MTPVHFPVLALLTISGLELSYAQSLPPIKATFAFTSCITVEPKAGPINTTAGQVFGGLIPSRPLHDFLLL